MILKIKNFIRKLRIFKRLRILTGLVERLRDESYMLKGQLINKRKTIDKLNFQLLEAVNNLNLLGEKLDKIEEKKKKGEIYIAELKKRRDEFMVRLSATPDVSITSFNDYKFWISEPFIVDVFKPYKPNKDDIDGVSAIRGLGEVFKAVDEKKEEK